MSSNSILDCLKHDEHGICCCNCKYLIADHSHPGTDGKRVTNQRGWICVGFLFCEGEAIGFSGWGQHGLCELHELQEEKPKRGVAIPETYDPRQLTDDQVDRINAIIREAMAQ